MADAFSPERETYERERGDMLRAHHGEYVLVQGNRIHGFFPTETEALRQAYHRLGDRTPFLVRRVERIEEEVPVLLGVIATTA